jgi:hypothetical protein
MPSSMASWKHTDAAQRCSFTSTVLSHTPTGIGHDKPLEP